ncbi:hypothetical protein [Clostridium neonatale]|uniref:hypothetical protein n=1 Tax=Clostridium neonatale TaxID=137838 RepID=UPI00291B42D1|nr:conserved hypothetical protein [Clostridium neonatale]CAI3700448.1 conserved hypothetical protein [Clostridium neonatale]CAI3700569.1 conserved hypothetical protein [Clostridium neonatale]CAI3721645.1 conserved hypothetical protein [Clostridium neonatale]
MSINKEETIVKSNKTKEQVSEMVVYLGPTILGVANKNTFFNNGLSEELKKAITDVPAIGKLVVPLSEYLKAMAQLDKKEGAIYSFYIRALEYNPMEGDR